MKLAPERSENFWKNNRGRGCLCDNHEYRPCLTKILQVLLKIAQQNVHCKRHNLSTGSYFITFDRLRGILLIYKHSFFKTNFRRLLQKNHRAKKKLSKKSIIQFVQISVILIELSWEYKCTFKIWWLKNLINYPHNIVKFLRQEKLGLNFSALL